MHCQSAYLRFARCDGSASADHFAIASDLVERRIHDGQYETHKIGSERPSDDSNRYGRYQRIISGQVDS